MCREGGHTKKTFTVFCVKISHVIRWVKKDQKQGSVSQIFDSGHSFDFIK